MQTRNLNEEGQTISSLDKFDANKKIFSRLSKLYKNYKVISPNYLFLKNFEDIDDSKSNRKKNNVMSSYSEVKTKDTRDFSGGQIKSSQSSKISSEREVNSKNYALLSHNQHSKSNVLDHNDHTFSYEKSHIKNNDKLNSDSTNPFTVSRRMYGNNNNYSKTLRKLINKTEKVFKEKEGINKFNSHKIFNKKLSKRLGRPSTSENKENLETYLELRKNKSKKVGFLKAIQRENDEGELKKKEDSLGNIKEKLVKNMTLKQFIKEKVQQSKNMARASISKSLFDKEKPLKSLTGSPDKNKSKIERNDKHKKTDKSINTFAMDARTTERYHELPINEINKSNLQQKINKIIIKESKNENLKDEGENISKNPFGNILYPIINQKKPLVNIIPKELEFNERIDPLLKMKSNYQSLLRYQKKILNKNVGALNQEIGVCYSKPFSLLRFKNASESSRVAQKLFEIEGDDDLLALIGNMLNDNVELDKEIENEIKRKIIEAKELRRRKVMQRFRKTIIRCAHHFCRLNLDLKDFFRMHMEAKTKEFGLNLITGDNVNTLQSEFERIENEEDKNNDALSELEKDKDKMVKSLNEKEEQRKQIIKLLYKKNTLISGNKVLQIMDENLKPCLNRNEESKYLFQALTAGDEAEVRREIYKHPILIFDTDLFGQTPLHICAKKNIYNLIPLFVIMGANIDAQDQGGRTPLIIASENHCYESLVLLLNDIADPNIKDSLGRKAIDCTNDEVFVTILKRVALLHHLYQFSKIRNFAIGIRNGLRFLLNYEVDKNFDSFIQKVKETNEKYAEKLYF